MKNFKTIRMFMTVVSVIAFLSGFTIAVGSTVTVTSPNGGETWTAGTANVITWTGDVIGNVRIALLKNGVQYALIASAFPNNGSFNWPIPVGMVSGTDYTVKISSCTDPLVSDVSDATFTIAGVAAATVTVTSPNGGESWNAGTANVITWTSNIIGNVRIALLKNGVQYSLIASAVPNSGSFNWLIPVGIVSGTDYTVKISSCTNSLISDVSDANFTINGGGGTTVTITSPNGGETWIAGTANVIAWTGDIIGNVRIALLKNGVQYALIASAIPNNSSFNWFVPAWMAIGTDYTVKISSCSNPLVTDVSDANFTISGGGGNLVTVTSPNGGESWTAGTANVITWTGNIIGNVRISLLKNGLQYALIASAIPSSGSFNWFIPVWMAAGTDYTVKISSCSNPLVSDVSDANFTIGGGGGNLVTVISPNGGETWNTGTTSTITWTSNIIGNVRIVLLKGGIQRMLISSATPNDGSHNWLVPACLLSGTDYTVKISSCTNPLITDVSDANFTINGGIAGTIVTVASPNGGEVWTAGTPDTITWISDVTGNLRIVLLKGGIQCALIAAGTPNDGSHIWLLPVGILPGTDYTVKISSCLNPLITDASDANFTIVPFGNEAPEANQNTTFKTGTVNIDDNAPALNLYPNPASDVLNVSADRDMKRVWVLNSLGQTVLENVVNAQQLQLNVNEYKQGIYFIRIETEGNISTRKVVIK